MVVALALGSSCKDDHRLYTLVQDRSTLRTTPLGQVIGGRGNYGDDVWMGVPFALPPMRDLRWRAPKPTPSWAGLRQALTLAPACPQFASPLAGVESSSPDEVVGKEDCLYLNIYAPHAEPKDVPKGNARLPVMLWIHGGGNSIGTAGFYDGGHLAVAEKVIVVTTQYRLGPLGWFHHAALREGEGAEPSGNFGTLDLIQALRWVHDNIESFGGNPDNVTVFGESAGGLNVFSLLLAPQAKGLFQRAIVESGGLSHTTVEEAENWSDDDPPGHSNSSNEVLGRLLVSEGKAKDRGEAKKKSKEYKPEELAVFLRDRPVKQILDSYAGGRGLGMLDMPLVFQDGEVLPKGDWTEKLSTSDGWANVPVLVGTNRDEAKLFLFFDPHRITRRFGIFPRYVDEPSYQATAEYLSRAWKATGADAPAAAMSHNQPHVYEYRFDWRGEPKVLGADVSQMIGAAHGMEIPFVFGHFHLGREARVLYDKAGEPARQELSRQMMSYWGEFAHQGDPGKGLGGDLPSWLSWSADPNHPAFLVLDVPAGGGLHMAGDTQTMESIIADVDHDTRLPTQVDKCRVFHDLAGWSHGISREDYPHAGKQGCGEFPFDKYPWEGKGDK